MQMEQELLPAHQMVLRPFQVTHCHKPSIHQVLTPSHQALADYRHTLLVVEVQRLTLKEVAVVAVPHSKNMQLVQDKISQSPLVALEASHLSAH
jgi:hypothetical protein